MSVKVKYIVLVGRSCWSFASNRNKLALRKLVAGVKTFGGDRSPNIPDWDWIRALEHHPGLYPRQRGILSDVSTPFVCEEIREKTDGN